MAANSTSGTLVANTVTNIILTKAFQRVEIINRNGAAEIWVRTDGTAPTVAGDECYVLPAVIGALTIGETTQNIQLISSGIPTFTVSGLD